MRRSIRTILFVALGLVITGMVFTGLAVATGGVDMLFNFNGNIDLEYKTATFDEVDFVNVENVSGTVKIIESEDSTVKVTYPQCDKFSFDITCEDKKLRVDFEDFRKWYEYIFVFGYSDTRLIIELPEKTLQELNVKTTSGSIEAKSVDALITNIRTTSGSVTVGGNVGDLSLHATSGRVELLGGTEAEVMKVSTTSGKLYVTGNVQGDVNADNSSGGIEIDSLICKDLQVKTSSGKIKGRNISAASLNADVSSGGIEFNDTICTEDMNLESTSGSIVLEAVDAKNYDLNSTSGGIKAEILSPKIYDADATSGSVRTPQLDANADGVLVAKTTSGSIKIELAD